MCKYRDLCMLTIYCSVTLSTGTLFFGNNIKSKMRILNLIGEIDLNKIKPDQKYFFQVSMRLLK